MAEKILLVDDDVSLIEICAVALRHSGYEVAVSPSGDEALELLKSQAFDLILTDLNMPGSINGHAVVREVKARYPGTEVVVFTAVPTLRTAIDTLKEGASDYLVKPFSIEHLKMVVRRCLDQRKLRSELSTERTLRQELASAYQELQKVERLKEAFLARVSHELRTPLHQLTMSLRLLEEDLKKLHGNEMAKPVPEMLRMSLQGAERLEKAIFDLLAFVDIQHLNTSDRFEPVDIEALCRKATEKFRPRWESMRLTMDVSFAPGTRQIEGDAESLGKAFEHLIHNAIVFNKEGGRIGIHAKPWRECVEIAFSDTGEGIPEAEFPKIFDSFYQIADYLTRKVNGLGLGLATTRRIVEAHGGSIYVSSELGKGTIFTVRMPLKKSTGAPPQQAASTPKTSKRS